MATDVVGSREPEFASEQNQKSTRGYGQNGYSGPSSVTPGKARAISKTYASLATDTMNVRVNPGDWQTRKISAAPIKSSPTMRNPNAAPAKIPNVLNRGGRPSTVAAKAGNAKR